MFSTEHSVIDISHIIHHLTACETVSELQIETLRTITNSVSAGVGVFVLHPDQTPQPETVFYGLEDRLENAYQEHYQHVNPFINWAQVMKNRWKRSVTRPDQFLHSIADTSFYRDFMHPNGMDHSMAIGILSQGRYLGVVGLFRPEGDSHFNEMELDKAELIAPAVKCALERLLFKKQVADWRWTAETLDSRLTCDGIVIVDDKWRIHYRNALAATLLGKLREPRDYIGELPYRLRRFCVRADATNAEEVEIETGIQLLREGFRITLGLDRISLRDGKRGHLVRLLPNASTVSETDRLRELGLTKREIDTINAVAAGLASKEIADRLYITLHTVNSHLKSIYRKLGVHNRAALLCRINQRTR